ncbi:DUF6838 family protein [Bacillus sp. FJAT-49736]|uniref:phage tail terminator family protein n=1 Tax=Bacillus sp. FJAT-49736 TaxID=2833582 RepID=UPI001BCA02B3|nr:hypothetical protein [Bacillus sp. FJAT-49736]MBS4172121.1 hypothetical protein [Bacillus sp. FJAT-49736]
MITINDISKSLISTLKKNFPQTRVYGEEIKQGFQDPCFFVKFFPVSQEREFRDRYKRYHSFDIHYFSDSKFPNDDMGQVAETLYQAMEYLPVKNGICRGTKMKNETIDGVLHFYVDYDFHVIKERAPGIMMKSIEQGGFLRE